MHGVVLLPAVQSGGELAARSSCESRSKCNIIINRHRQGDTDVEKKANFFPQHKNISLGIVNVYPIQNHIPAYMDLFIEIKQAIQAFQ